MLFDLYVLFSAPESTVLTMLVVFTLSVLIVACVPTFSGLVFKTTQPGLYLFRSLSLLVSFIPVF